MIKKTTESNTAFFGCDIVTEKTYLFGVCISTKTIKKVWG